MGEDRGRCRRCGAEIADHVAAGAGPTGLGNGFVTADVIPMHMGVDDVANRLVADRLDGIQDLRAERRELGVYDHHAVFTGHDRRVPAGADQHVNTVADVDHVLLYGIEVLLRLREGAAGQPGAHT